MYYPTIWDICVYVGTLGFFFFTFMMFLRILPAISIFEMREQVDHIAKHTGTNPRWEPGQAPSGAAGLAGAAHSPAGSMPEGGLP
jgi:hypothetical protein